MSGNSGTSALTTAPMVSDLTWLRGSPPGGAASVPSGGAGASASAAAAAARRLLPEHLGVRSEGHGYRAR
jgi:hypothetical protein